MRYFYEQSNALESYTVRTVDCNALKKQKYVTDMDSNLRASYENAFTKNELVVLSCLLAYTGLTFCNIRQKISMSLSNGAVRGKAFVPVQLRTAGGILTTAQVFGNFRQCLPSQVHGCFVKHLFLSPTGVLELEIYNFMGIGFKYGVTYSKLSFVFVNR